jgi:hypothetical protein
MWREPYLETCCRAALHRVVLSGEAGRPLGLADQPCLERLAEMGLVSAAPAGIFTPTQEGRQRHRSEILREPGAA